MNSSLTKKALKINGFFTKNSASLLAAMLISAVSTSVFANRPAMDEPSEVMNETATQTETQTQEAAAQSRPEADAPSAVELMMQQQSQQPRQVQTGDVLQLPAKEMQPGETLKIQLLDSPRRGMSMERVQQEYGQPMATSESVGQPPITHWTYSDRVVYFEYSTVLHVVAR